MSDELAHVGIVQDLGVGNLAGTFEWLPSLYLTISHTKASLLETDLFEPAL